MKVLVIGGGGREHALAWKLCQSKQVKEVLVAPGNAGTALEPSVRNITPEQESVEGFLRLALSENVDLTVVGPEAPLVAGIVDTFQAAGLRCFGPSKAAAQLEGSKAFSKDFMERHAIPTAQYAYFTEVDAAIAYIREQGAPIVVKADGLAAGKGVVLAKTEQEAIAAVEDMLMAKAFGHAGSQVLLESFLTGEEASFMVMVDGEHILSLASSQDHKARDNGDQGPNTGGMGAYSPAPVVTPEIHQRIMQEVIQPTVKGMAAEGTPYCGFLYAGVMIASDGSPRVLEFNCRLGDPETQPMMMRLDSDLATLIIAALDGNLDKVQAEWDEQAAIGVVMAAGGYPAHYQKGAMIHGLEQVDPAKAKVFHAGTVLKDEQVLTQGGRVLCVVAKGETVTLANKTAYAALYGISWENAYFRTDIGYRAMQREQA